MKIYTYYLKSKLEAIEKIANVKFEKALEKTFVAVDDDRFIFYSHFNCVAFVGYSDKEASAYARMLNASEDYIQDFEINVDESLNMPFLMKGDMLTVQTPSVEIISIAALTVMQSVGLDIYETRLDEELKRSKALFTQKPKWFFRGQKVVDFVSSNVILRHELVSDLRLLDKPLMAWDDDVCDSLYNKLSKFFELKERFDIIEYKIGLLKDDLMFILDTERNKKSAFLEWIVIILIALEVVIGVYEILAIKAL